MERWGQLHSGDRIRSEVIRCENLYQHLAVPPSSHGLCPLGEPEMQALTHMALRQQGPNNALLGASVPSLSSGPEDVRKDAWEKAVWTEGRDLYNSRR